MGWGQPPSLILWAHEKPRFTPRYSQQRAEPGFEQGALSALITSPGTSCHPRRVTW